MNNITVAICTYNPIQEYLDRTLDALKRQSLSTDSWELLIIDNRSEPPIVDRCDLSWHPNARIIRELKPGLTAARLKAIDESSYDPIVFFDDDNIPDANYLERIREHFEANPEIGTIGAARIIPEFSTEPEEDLRPFTAMLALRDEPGHISDHPKKGRLPYGAGISLRSTIAKEYAKSVSSSKERQSLGRSGNSLLGGEDDEITWTAHRLGYKYALLEDLKLIHLIPASRVDRNYLERLIYANGYSAALLAHINGQVRPSHFKRPSLRAAVGALSTFKIGLFKARLNAWRRFRKATQTVKTMRTLRVKGYDDALKSISK